jgi:hypothetical protein
MTPLLLLVLLVLFVWTLLPQHDTSSLSEPAGQDQPQGER